MTNRSRDTFSGVLAALALALSACGGDGSGSRDAPAPALELLFSAEPTTLTHGESALLSWAARHAERCEADAGWTGERPLAGTETVTPASAGLHRYRLRCTGPAGFIERDVELQVQPALAVALVLSIEPAQIALGEAAVLRWHAEHAVECIAGGDWSGSRDTDGEETVQPTRAGRHDYRISCSGSGEPATAATELEVLADPAAEARATQAALRAMEQGCCARGGSGEQR